MSCWVTSCSRVFDKTVRLDTGRYDFPSDGSRSGFFNNGVTNAVLNCVGNTPRDNDLLNSSVSNGASRSTLSFSSTVGIRSVVHCLFWSLRITAMISLTLRHGTRINCSQLALVWRTVVEHRRYIHIHTNRDTHSSDFISVQCHKLHWTRKH